MFWAMNNPSNKSNKIDYRLTNEWCQGFLVQTLQGTLTVPPRLPLEFHKLWLCATGSNLHIATGVSMQVTKWAVTPTTPYRRLLGAWGTKPRDDDLMDQQQCDNVVRFGFDADFDVDLAKPDGSGTTTDGKVQIRGAKGAWPPGLCSGFYFRGECGRTQIDTGKKGQVAQFNVAATGVEGSAGDRWFDARAKGVDVQTGQYQDVSLDQIWCAILPGATTFAVFNNTHSKFNLLFAGYELLPT